MSQLPYMAPCVNQKKELLWTEAAPFGEQRDGWISAPILPLCEELLQPLTFKEKDIVGEANCVSPITVHT